MTPFLFASPDGRGSSSARRVHLRRLYDILHLSIQRGDLLLAQRSFALLSRCEDVEWAAIWKFGLIVLAAADQPPGDVNLLLGTPNQKHFEFLRVMMLRHPEEVRTHLPLPSYYTAPDSPTHHLSHWTARITRAGAGIVTGYGWTGT
jgi:RNA polymerase I specific initiation factor